MTSYGAIWVGVGAWAPAAAMSAIAFKRWNPEVNAKILTTKGFQVEGIEEILFHQPESDEDAFKLSRSLKTSIEQYNPWQQMLYLDADILCLGPVPELFRHGFRMCPEGLPSVEYCDHIRGEEYDFTVRHYKAAPMYNAGMFSIDRTVARAFMPEWHREWGRFKRYDQLAHARAIANLGVKVWDMPRKFNWPIHSYTTEAIASADVRLLHCHTSRMSLGNFFRVAEQVCPNAYETAKRLGITPE